MLSHLIKLNLKRILVFGFLCSLHTMFSQVSSSNSNQEIALNPAKVALFEKYPEFKYNIIPGSWQNIKLNNPELYKKELWYYTESFYIKRDHFTSGISLPEASIDISRFERKRKAQEEVMVKLEGYKDVIVLIPGNELIYKPE